MAVTAPGRDWRAVAHGHGRAEHGRAHGVLGRRGGGVGVHHLPYFLLLVLGHVVGELGLLEAGGRHALVAVVDVDVVGGLPGSGVRRIKARLCGQSMTNVIHFLTIKNQ